MGRGRRGRGGGAGNWVERVAASVPMDRTAARVLSSKGHAPPEQESPDPNNPHWKDIPTDDIVPVPPQVPNLMGKRMGFFQVVGLYRYRNSKKQWRWVVACKCGAYEIRTEQALCNLKNTDDKCAVCRKEEYKRNHPEEFRTPTLRPTDGGMLGMPPPREFPESSGKPKMAELLKINETLRKRLKKVEDERNALVSKVDKARSAVKKHVKKRLSRTNIKAADTQFFDRLSNLLSREGKSQ